MIEFIPGDILKVKEEWLDVGEDPDTEYFVVDYNPDNNHVKVICKWNGFTGYLTYEWPADTMYKVGHIEVDDLKKMISMKEEFSDHLIEGYLVETYTSQKAASELERLESEKAFKKELTNGPERMVVAYRNGISYPKKIGSFDLDNFHKAYDQWFEEQDLLKIFNDEGKLAARNSYAEIKAFDKKIPAVSALLKLWGAQFSNDMMFTKDKLKKEADEAADKEKIEKLTAEFEANEEKITKEVYEAVTTSELWKQLVETYPESDRDKIKLTVSVFSTDEAILRLRVPVDVLAVHLEIEGVLLPPIESQRGDYSTCVILKELMSIEELIKKCTHPNTYGLWLHRIISVSKAAFYLMENYKVYEERLESKVFNEAGFYNEVGLTKFPLWICYFDPATDKYYKATLKDFGNNNVGIMLIDIDDAADKSHRLTLRCKVVATLIASRSTTARCYQASYSKTLFNPSYPESVFKKLDVEIKDREEGGAQKNYTKIKDAEEPYNKICTKASIKEFELDSGD